MLAGTSLFAVLAAVLLGAVALGGGIYETLLIDRSWPRMPEMIQPARGGIKRALFWGPVNGLFELSLLVSLSLTWTTGPVRKWIIAAFVIHLASRIWSFLYFIPTTLRFERTVPSELAQNPEVPRWVRLSRWRILLGACAVLALMGAMVAGVRQP